MRYLDDDPVVQAADEYLVGYQRSLTAKRQAAFMRQATNTEYQRAYRDLMETNRHQEAFMDDPLDVRHERWLMANFVPRQDAAPPPRSGERTKLALCVLLVAAAVLMGLVWAGLRWRAGITW